MDKFPIKILGGGAAMLALVTALGWGGVSMIIRGQLKQVRKYKMRKIPNSHLNNT
jgi:hypothetical protein